MSRLWDNRLPVDWVDPQAILFCGADPAWSPEKENRTPEAPDNEEGLCLLCGGVGEFDESKAEAGQLVFKPGRILHGQRLVCARCMRYGLDYRLKDMKPVEAVEVEVVEDNDEVVQSGPGYVRRGAVQVPEKYARLMKR